MSVDTFSVTTGNPQVITIRQPGGPALIGIQNDGAVTLTVKGKLAQSADFAALGTIAASTIGGIALVPGITSIELSASAAHGVVVS